MLADADEHTVANRLRQGLIWRPHAETGGDWTVRADLTRGSLAELRGDIEELHDAGAPGVPGGKPGARMMLRALAVNLGHDPDPASAAQIRAVAVFPARIDAGWRDRNGRRRRWRVTVQNTERWQHAIEAQMQAWSDRLFKISGGKFAVHYRVKRRDAPVTSLTRVKGGAYLVYPGDVEDAPQADPREVAVLVFWVPRQGRHRPPTSGRPGRRTNAYMRPGKIGTEDVPYYLFPITTVQRLEQWGSWSRGEGGLMHEFWYVVKRELDQSGFKGFIPGNHDRLAWESFQAEIQLQGLPLPDFRFEDYYRTVVSWRTIRLLQSRWGYQDQWGAGPRASRSIA